MNKFVFYLQNTCLEKEENVFDSPLEKRGRGRPRKSLQLSQSLSLSQTSLEANDFTLRKESRQSLFCDLNDQFAGDPEIRTRGRPRKNQLQSNINPESKLIENSSDNNIMIDARHVLVIDCQAKLSIETMVPTSSLVGYQEDLFTVLQDDGYTIDEETKDFLEGLIYFADWDDYECESFVWDYYPIVNIVRNPNKWFAWRQQIYHSKSYTFLYQLFSKSRSKIFCFYLCASILSMDDEIDTLIVDILQPTIEKHQFTSRENNSIHINLNNQKNSTSSSSSSSSSPIVVSVNCAQSILIDLLNGITKLNPKESNSPFRRHSCRVGNMYQAEIPTLNSSSLVKNKSISSIELKYQPNNELDSFEIDRFLF